MKAKNNSNNKANNKANNKTKEEITMKTNEEKKEALKPDQASWTKQEISKFENIRNHRDSESKNKYSDYEEIRQMFLVDRIQEKRNVNLNNELIHYVSNELNLQVLYRFDKAYSCPELMKINEASKEGRLPFYAFSNLGHLAVERIEPTNEKEAVKYVSKLNTKQIAKLEAFLQDSKGNKVKRIKGKLFNEAVEAFFPKVQKPEASDYEKLNALLKSAKSLTKKGKFSFDEKLKAQADISILISNLANVEEAKEAKEVKSTEVKSPEINVEALKAVDVEALKAILSATGLIQ